MDDPNISFSLRNQSRQERSDETLLTVKDVGNRVVGLCHSGEEKVVRSADSIECHASRCVHKQANETNG